MPTTTPTDTPTLTVLGPLTRVQRSAIMDHARALSPETRRIFRRLLVLAQERGLDGEIIAHAAAQARGHVVAA